MPAPRLVDAMVEFVDTRQEQLVAKYTHLVPQSQAHTESDLYSVPRDVLMLPHGPVAQRSPTSA